MLVREETGLRHSGCGKQLISLAPAKGSLGSGGGSTGCSGLDSSVGQDSVGELLLGLGEAGTCSSVLRVDLGEWEMRRRLGQ